MFEEEEVPRQRFLKWGCGKTNFRISRVNATNSNPVSTKIEFTNNYTACPKTDAVHSKMFLNPSLFGAEVCDRVDRIGVQIRVNTRGWLHIIWPLAGELGCIPCAEYGDTSYLICHEHGPMQSELAPIR